MMQPVSRMRLPAGVGYALAAAALFGASTPLSKLLLGSVEPILPPGGRGGDRLQVGDNDPIAAALRPRQEQDCLLAGKGACGRACIPPKSCPKIPKHSWPAPARTALPSPLGGTALPQPVSRTNNGPRPRFADVGPRRARWPPVGPKADQREEAPFAEASAGNQ